MIDEWSRYYDGKLIVFLTHDKREFNQGEWIVNGIPAGGFSVYPTWYLDPVERKKTLEGRTEASFTVRQ